MISIATWNVNSIKPRLPHLLEYIAGDGAPEVLLLQETKTVDDAFPREPIEDAGYNLALYGQKSYNGVAILSKYPLSDVVAGLPGTDGGEARYIEALIECGDMPIRAASVYVPNGQAPDSPKFSYKLGFMAGLRARMQQLWDAGGPVVVGGDFNAVFSPALDTYDPALLEGGICCNPQERRHMQSYAAMGWCDLFRAKHPLAQEYSWWDYRAGARQKNLGLRIDFLLASPEAADTAQNVVIDGYLRDKPSPSDHVPVRASFVARI